MISSTDSTIFIVSTISAVSTGTVVTGSFTASTDSIGSITLSKELSTVVLSLNSTDSFLISTDEIEFEDDVSLTVSSFFLF